MSIQISNFQFASMKFRKSYINNISSFWQKSYNKFLSNNLAEIMFIRNSEDLENRVEKSEQKNNKENYHYD